MDDPRNAMGPPRLARLILTRLLPRRTAEEAVGDLDEEFSQSQGRSRASLRFRYWGGAASLLVHSLAARLERISLPRLAGANPMRNILFDLRQALRALRKRPLFFSAAVLTLALGIGANSAVFSVVEAVLLRPLPFADSDRLRLIWLQRPGQLASQLEFEGIQEGQRGFEALAYYSGWELSLESGEEPAVLSGAAVSARFFDLLGVSPLTGRFLAPSDAHPGAPGAAVISHRLWQQRFGGDPAVVGRRLLVNGQGGQLEGQRSYAVVGVMPPDLRLPFQKTDLWLPIWSDSSRSTFDARFWWVIGRLSDGVSPSAAREEIASQARRLKQDRSPLLPSQRSDFFPADYGDGVELTTLREHFSGAVRSRLLTLWAAVAFVLLIACVNVANLQLSRAALRRPEFAMRGALGAGKGRLLRLMLIESVTLAAVGGAVGLALAWASLRILVAGLPPETYRVETIGLNPAVLAFTLAAAVLAGIASGLTPALRLLRGGDSGHLRLGGRDASKGRSAVRVSRLLAAGETALALTLVIGAGLMLQSFWRLTRVDPGFEPSGVVEVRVAIPSQRYSTPAEVADFVRRGREGLAALPGVEAAGAVHIAPFTGYHWGNPLDVEGRVRRPGERRPVVNWQLASAGYFRTLGIPLKEGRLFQSGDSADSQPVAIVSETMARRIWPGESPLGQRIRTRFSGQAWSTVVGVVGDVRHHGLDEQMHPEMYRPLSQAPFRNLSFMVRTDAAAPASIPALRERLRLLDPRVPVRSIGTLESSIADSIGQERLSSRLSAIFAFLASALGAIGIYGVLADSVSLRRREMGVRLALGARPARLLAMVVRQGMITAAWGVALGLGASIWLSRFLSSQLFEVNPADPALFALLSAALLGVAALACYIPARRAARTDPLEALRAE